MTVSELLAYSNEIEYRALAVQTNALACLRQPPPPPVKLQTIRGRDFVMFADEELWAMQRPEPPPINPRKVYAAGFATGLCVSAASFAALLMLVKP